MRPETYHVEAVVQLLRKRKIATMAELRTALGTPVDMTVFRKLRSIDYLSSYSHGGRFYTLRESADFDARGLWCYRDVRFSKIGSLVDTCEDFVVRADAGCFASELATDLGVEVKDVLRKLVNEGRLVRERVTGAHLYCAPARAQRRQQVERRRSAVPAEPFGDVPKPMSDASNVTRDAIILFLQLLDERQRRLFAGLESLRMGWGGDQRIAEWTGLDVHTVAKGRHELMSQNVDHDRVRRPGAGRPSVEKKRQRSSKPSSS